MLYRFAWVLMWVTFKIYFRRIDVIGLKHLQSGKPYVLIANHPASFLDAMVLAVFLKRDVHFYVRGDIFHHPPVYWILTRLHMIPIFSREHGMEHVGKNYNTFERGKKLLRRGDLLLIFPEGFSRLSKKVEPLKKGAARVALQTAFDQNGVEDLTIQTIAINYSHHGVRSDLFIRLGENFSLAQYKEMYEASPAKAVSELTHDMLPYFERNIIHLHAANRTFVAEEIISFTYNDHLQEVDSFFDAARAACKNIDDKNDVEYDAYVTHLNQYKALLNSHGMRDRSLSSNKIQHIMTILNLLLTIEVYVIGKIFWAVPGALTKWIADKTVTRIDFYTSVTSGVLAFASLIWWVFWMIVVFNWNSVELKILMSSMPFFAYVTMRWEYDFIDLKSDFRFKKLSQEQPALINELKELRKLLLA
jgi:1-acyl-sn-glycerol-3-phosphate acyltransferase